MKILSARQAAELARVGRLELLTSAEAALWCRVSLTTFNLMVKTIPIPFVRPSGKGDRRFFRSTLDACLRARVENLPAA